MGNIILIAVLLILAWAAWAAVPKAPPILGYLRLVVPSVLVGIAAINLIFSMWVVVAPGHVGVIHTFGKVDPVPLENGLHFVAPWRDVTQMSTQIAKYEGKYDAASVDIQAVHAVIVANVALKAACAPDVYRTIGVNYLSVIIDPAASETFKAITALHAASEILAQRPKIKGDMQDLLGKWLTKYCLQVHEVSIKDIRFDPDFMKAVEAKQVAQQVAQQKKNEVEQAKADAEKQVATAKGEGDAKRAEAQGLADALRIKGEAEANYNQKVAASLSPTLIQQQWITRWDGNLPTYMFGNGSGVMLQLPIPQQKVAER